MAIRQTRRVSYSQIGCREAFVFSIMLPNPSLQVQEGAPPIYRAPKPGARMVSPVAEESKQCSRTRSERSAIVSTSRL
jgi:hypothetical protein